MDPAEVRGATPLDEHNRQRGVRTILEDQLSPAALRALERAKAFARVRGAQFTELLDLLAGLLFDAESKASLVLTERGGDVNKLRSLLNIPADPGEHPGDEFPLSPGVREVIGQAKEYILAVNRYEQVGSEELLTALLELGEELHDAFEQSGIDQKAIVKDFHASRAPEPLNIPTESLNLTPRDAGIDATDLARMVDANANRAREALRVLEDYCRFVLDDEACSQLLKECRHQLREALHFFPPHWLLAARDTTHDVGTWISTREEFAREGLWDVVGANCKRAQEAVRTLEEAAKVENANAARILEQVRYRLYTIEKRLGIGVTARSRLAGVVLYWLVDPEQCVAAFDWMLEQAIQGGVQMVQLRDKRANDRELLDLGRRFREVTHSLGALLIINDRPDIARLCHADGVHVGQEDLSVRDVRRILGPDAIVGVSTHELSHARQAVEDGADYIGVGPVFPSKTKTFDEFAGLHYVRQVADEIRLPAYCIGGIDAANVEQVLAAGGRRIAVSNALCSQREPRGAAQTLRAKLDDAT